MSPELAAYYERRLAMMGDQAWNDLLEDVEAMLQATNDITTGYQRYYDGAGRENSTFQTWGNLHHAMAVIPQGCQRRGLSNFKG